MNKKTQFSVLIPIYSKESPQYLAACFDSLITQTMPADDIVVVFDGEVTKALQDVVIFYASRLPIVKIGYRVNRGLGYALNFGLKQCKFNLVARMDADDICEYKRFETQLSYMLANPGIDILGSWATLIDERGQFKGVSAVPLESDIIKRLIWSCPIIHPSVMYRKEKILSIGSYKTDVAHRQEDYELWIRTIKNNLVIANLPVPLIRYREANNKPSKNGFRVALNRMRIGIPAALKYDFRVASLLALCFPLARLMLPSAVVSFITNRFDPRK